MAKPNKQQEVTTPVELTAVELTAVELTAEEKLAERNRKISEAQRGKPRSTIAVIANGVGYSSICAAMKVHGIKDKGTKNWFVIRKALKATGKVEHSGVKFELPVTEPTIEPTTETK